MKPKKITMKGKKMAKGKFKCWSCHKVYVKKVDEDWSGWTCPLCGVVTGGTGSQVDKRTSANITLPPPKPTKEE